MQLFRTVEENLRAAMACYSRVSDRGESREYPGVVVTCSGVNIAVFNSALLTAPATLPELEQAIAVSSLHFQSKSMGWSFWLCDDFLEPGLRAPSRNILRERGLSLVAQPPGMYAEQVNAATRPPVPMDIRPIDDVRTRLDFAHISSIVFALPFTSAKRIYSESALWQPPMRGWVGYVNDRAVSVVTSVMAGDVAGVYSLGTLPQHRCRGFGETLLRHAIEEARKDTGITRSILQSTNDGFNLYMRMGYQVVTGFGVYTKEHHAM